MAFIEDTLTLDIEDVDDFVRVWIKILLIGSSLFVYEVISFDIAYKKSLEVKKVISCCSLCKK